MNIETPTSNSGARDGRASPANVSCSSLVSRRSVLKRFGAATGLAVCGSLPSAGEEAGGEGDDQYGVLVDTTRCVGCRRCEQACNRINTDLPRKDDGFYRDQSVFGKRRRMDASAYTVVNRYTDSRDPSKQAHVKFQCMHCRDSACVSACIVGALTRDDTGAVLYDSWKCIGCRYCMIACPFQVPAYEYSDPLTPKVRKCTFCHQTRLRKGLTPACVQSCPMEVMTFGKRSDVLALARDRMKQSPGRYVSHIYGEHEAGGTSWMYLSGIPFNEIDLPGLGYHPTPGYTEPIQHAIFKWFLPPLSLYAALGGIWWYLSGRRKRKEEGQCAAGRDGERACSCAGGGGATRL